MSSGKILTTGLRFPEGPVTLPDGSLLVVEIERGTLVRVTANGAKSTVAHLGGGPNGAAIGPDGACYVCNNGGFKWHEEPQLLRPVLQAENYTGGSIQRVDLTTGEVITLYTGTTERPLKGPNDLVFDASGGFWFTDMGKARERDIDRSVVYYARPDGSLLKPVISPMLGANGIGISPDGRKLYVAETLTARLWAFEITGPGTIRPQPWPSPNGGTLVTGMTRYQMFDSLALEENGNICVATIVAGGITVISPTGELVDFVEVPDRYCTNICFGGPDLRTAFITLSGTGQVLTMNWPRPGLRLNF